MKSLAWLPLAVVGLAALISYGYAASNPLPANGYGHSIYDVHTVLSVPAGSTLMVPIAGDQFVPRGSLVLVTAGVVNRLPNSDFYEYAYFRITQAGSTIEEGLGNAVSSSFETRQDTQGSDNPRLSIRNDHAFALQIDFRAFVLVPPTTWERFLLYVPGLGIAGALAFAWLSGFVIVSRKPAQNA